MTPWTPADGVTAEWLEDGRLSVCFRQSGLNTLTECLERGRLLALMPKSDKSSDAAAIGTAVHGAIEYALRYLMDEGEVVSDPELLIAGAKTHFKVLEPEWVKYNEETAARFIERAVNTWYDNVYPLCRPVETEYNFGPLKVYEDERFVIYISGTIDYIDERMGLVDWKTSGRKWQPWEAQRWYNQPTIYRIAALKAAFNPYVTNAFTYFVFYPSGDHERITVTRHLGHSQWAIRKMLAICGLIAADFEPWPMTDDTALCSDDWCPAWSQCKGAYVPKDWRARSSYEVGIQVGESKLLQIQPTGSDEDRTHEVGGTASE